jgi:cytochrome P450
MQLGGIAITPRAGVYIPIDVVHRHVRLWDNPTAFDPDRCAAAGGGKAALCLMPFGGGPRVCIGASFAMIEAAVIPATVRAFRFRPVPGHKPRLAARITLRPRAECRCRSSPADRSVYARPDKSAFSSNNRKP